MANLDQKRRLEGVVRRIRVFSPAFLSFFIASVLSALLLARYTDLFYLFDHEALVIAAYQDVLLVFAEIGKDFREFAKLSERLEGEPPGEHIVEIELIECLSILVDALAVGNLDRYGEAVALHHVISLENTVVFDGEAHLSPPFAFCFPSAPVVVLSTTTEDE